MDLRQLNALVAVADHASFSAAARALHTVQSNVSTHVARLERELGVTLVNRNGGALTEEGEVVAARARRIQNELDALTADVAAVRDVVTGSAMVAMIGSTARWLAPAVFEAMAVEHPNVDVILHDASSSLQLPQLVSGRIEVGVLALPVDDPDVSTAPLFEEDSQLIVPEDHPLAAHDKIDITALANQPLLLLPRGTSFRDSLDDAAAKAGIELTAKAEVDGMRLVATMAFQGYGAAIAPASAAPVGATGAWRSVQVDGLPRRQVGLAQRKRSMLSAPARAFIEVLSQVLTEKAASQSGIHASPELAQKN